MLNKRLIKHTRLSKKHRWKKAALSVLLTAAMVCANIGSQVGTVMAAESGSYEDGVFELDGRNIYFSINEAIKNGDELSKDDIEFTNGKIMNYRQLFYGENRKAGEKLYLEEVEDSSFRIIEFFPEYESGMDVELRTFIRLPADSGDDYQLTGEEQIILLYLNNSSEDVKCSVKIDGRNKCSITVKSYESAFGDDEVAIFSKDFNTESQTDDESSESSSLESTGETVEANGSESGDNAAVTDPADDSETGIPDSSDADGSTTDTPESPDADDVDNSEASDDTENSGSKETDGAKTDESEEKEHVTEAEKSEEKEHDTDSVQDDDKNAGGNADDDADSASEQDIQPMASLSRHQAPVLAAPDMEGEAKAPAGDKAQEAEAPADDRGQEAEPPADDRGQEAEAPAGDKVQETEAPSKETSGEADTTSEEKTDNGAGDASEETTGKEESSQVPESPDGTLSPDGTSNTSDAEQSGGETSPQPETSEGSQSQPESSEGEITLPEESSSTPIVPEKTLPAETEVIDEKEETDFAAVKDGKYPLVGIDGCVSAKAYVTPLNRLGVDLTKIDQGFSWQQEMDGGVIITLKADEEASEFLTADVTAEILEISDSAREAIALNAGILPQDVVAYDINLFDAEGNKIENEAWNGNVTISFSGERIEQMSAQSDALAVIHEGSELDGSGTDINPDDIDLQILSTVEIPGDETVTELSGDTASFSIIGVIPQPPDKEMNVDLAWRDIGWPIGNDGDAGDISLHHYYLEINGLPAFCITPGNLYPTPDFRKSGNKQALKDQLEDIASFNTFLTMYEAVPMKDLEDQQILEGIPALYSKENLLKASLMIQLGYPEDLEGICWDWANEPDNASSVKDWTPSSKTMGMFYQTQAAEQLALTDRRFVVEELGQRLYDRGIELYERYQDPIVLEIKDNVNIVFTKAEGDDVWLSNEFSISTSEKNYSLDFADDIDDIIVEQKTESGWDILTDGQLKAIPKDSVLRLTSISEPGDGAIDINVSKNRIVLDLDKCYFFKPKESVKGHENYQILMIVDNKDQVDTSGLNVSYSTPPPSDRIPDESQTPVPETSETETTVPETSETETTVPETSETETTVPETSETETTVPETNPQETSAPVPTDPVPTLPDNPGGGGGGSNIGRIDTNTTRTTDNGGPGDGTVTLEDLDVPLADLPPSPSDPVVILDEEVPLASLPKTGVKTGVKEVSFILSSAILALYTLISRKKDSKLKL